MFKESLLDKTLYFIKKLIPKSIFNFFQPAYHTLLAYAAALRYGFPSRKLKVIGVTGTKGKSTAVFLITKIFEGTGNPVASIGSLGFKIRDREWPNHLKMTMPGRFKIQKFLREAVNAGCEYVVMEVTSEGIKQKRHIGVRFDCAVFINIHPEHIENHGSFEKYLAAKQELFKVTKNIHILNGDDANYQKFSQFPAVKTIFYGKDNGDVRFENFKTSDVGSTFEIQGIPFSIGLFGDFNIYNTTAAIATAGAYGIMLKAMQPIIETIKFIPGRMQFIQREPFAIVVDYAHTPDSLETVYRSLKFHGSGRLICVLGAAGGGRDTWKRPEFGRIADAYCDKIFLTDEDPYEENPEKILDQVQAGITHREKIIRVLDRKEAIGLAIKEAEVNDIVIITGKGSEISMAVAGGKKIPWSDADIVRSFLPH
jgi:UDP-N-acetylmuramoyl-L-alanyl-D-glutamate--2,6-diaminopimelate ligase